MVTRLPELAHVDLARVAISFSQARKDVEHGMQASLTPLRFAGGAMTTVERGRRYGCQPIVDESGNEYLYVLSFYLPRFQNHSVEEKLSTILHELWHISPAFDGDLRRHSGRCYAHGGSQQAYDRRIERLAQKWLAMDPPHHLYDFLERTFDGLVAEHGRVYGRRVPSPKLFPLDGR